MSKVITLIPRPKVSQINNEERLKKERAENNDRVLRAYKIEKRGNR